MIECEMSVKEWFEAYRVHDKYGAFRPLHPTGFKSLRTGRFLACDFLHNKDKHQSLYEISEIAARNSLNYDADILNDQLLENLEKDVQRYDEAVKYRGWTSASDRRRLYLLAAVSPGDIVEIGVFTGNGTAHLAMATSNTVYAIDSQTPSTHLHNLYTKGDNPIEISNNLWKELSLENIEYISGCSYNVYQQVPEEIGMLFLDGGHTKEEILRDLQCYSQKIKSSGILAFHEWGVTDYWSDTFEALKEYMYDQADQWIGPFTEDIKDPERSKIIWFVRNEIHEKTP